MTDAWYVKGSSQVHGSLVRTVPDTLFLECAAICIRYNNCDVISHNRVSLSCMVITKSTSRTSTVINIPTGYQVWDFKAHHQSLSIS